MIKIIELGNKVKINETICPVCNTKLSYTNYDSNYSLQDMYYITCPICSAEIYVEDPDFNG